MRMSRLGNAPAESRVVRQHIALDKSDPLEVPTERFGGEQTGHAPAKHDN